MVHADLVSLLEELETLADSLDIAETSRAAAMVRERALADEWYVAVVGRVSAGKSTWVNSLLGEALLPATPMETTAVTVEVRFSQDGAPCFEARSLEGWRELSREDFARVAECPECNSRLRLTWPLADVRPDAREALATVPGLVLLDLPGSNGLDAARATELAHVLPEADAVVLMLNWRDSVRPRDLELVEAIPALERSVRPPLLCAVNWGPPIGGEEKFLRMQQILKESLPDCEPRASLLATQESAEGVRIWNSQLWNEVVSIARDTGRTERVRAGLLSLVARIHDDLAQALDARIALADGAETSVTHCRSMICDRLDGQKQAHARIEKALGDMKAKVEQIVKDGRAETWQEINVVIDDAARIIDARSCRAEVGEVIIPRQLSRTTNRLSEELEAAAEALAQDLEKLVPELGEVDIPVAIVDAPQWSELRDAAARNCVHRLAYGGAGRYLNQMGGAAGEGAGIVNLSKRLVSKAGALVGRTFPRTVYDNMGRALKRLGVTANLAKTAFAAVMVETVAFIYHLARWKQKLRGVVQHTLDLPAVDEPIEDALLRKLPGRTLPKPFSMLGDDAAKAVTETLNATQKLVDDNIGRRVTMLKSALAQREAKSLKMEPLREAVRLHRDLGQRIAKMGGGQ